MVASRATKSHSTVVLAFSEANGWEVRGGVSYALVRWPLLVAEAFLPIDWAVSVVERQVRT